MKRTRKSLDEFTITEKQRRRVMERIEMMPNGCWHYPSRLVSIGARRNHTMVPLRRLLFYLINGWEPELGTNLMAGCGDDTCVKPSHAKRPSGAFDRNDVARARIMDKVNRMLALDT